MHSWSDFSPLDNTTTEISILRVSVLRRRRRYRLLRTAMLTCPRLQTFSAGPARRFRHSFFESFKSPLGWTWKPKTFAVGWLLMCSFSIVCVRAVREVNHGFSPGWPCIYVHVVTHKNQTMLFLRRLNYKNNHDVNGLFSYRPK